MCLILNTEKLQLTKCVLTFYLIHKASITVTGYCRTRHTENAHYDNHKIISRNPPLASTEDLNKVEVILR